jgi:hypothetical protein
MTELRKILDSLLDVYIFEWLDENRCQELIYSPKN